MKSLVRSATQLCLVVLLAVILPRCSQEEQQDDYEKEQQEALNNKLRTNQRNPSKQARATNAPEMVIVPVVVRQDTGLGTSLALNAAASLYTIQLDECDSNYTSTATESSTNLQVYKFDTGCKAKLLAFSFNGVTYTPSDDDGFDDYQVGDAATFEVANDPTDTLRVTVLSTLEDPIAGTEQIIYEFSEIAAGADEVLAQAKVGAGHTMTVSGHASPSFTIASVSFDGLDAGAGLFTFTLECTEALDDDLCIDVDLNDIRYKLIEDVNNTSTLTYAQAQALFPANEEQIDLNTELLAPGQGGTVNGGFVTKSLTGPATIHSKPHMLLVLEAADLSYLYFNVDVTVLTQD